MNNTSRVATWWPVVCGTTIAIEAILAALIFFGPLEVDAATASQLTQSGLAWFHPERDIPIYTRGCALMALFVAGLALLWNWRAQRNTDALSLVRAALAEIQIFVVLFAAELVLLIGERWRFATEKASTGGVILAFAPPALALAAVAIGIFRPLPMLIPLARPTEEKPDRKSDKAKSKASRAKSQAPPPETAARLLTWLDALVVLLLIALVFIPNCKALAGYFYMQEEFHHWDFFAMGPTLGFLHGKAFGRDFYSQYGAGWALLFNALAPVLPISYGGMLRFVTTYGCLYFTGLYFLLRTWLRDSVWAAVAVLFAVTLQLFHGLDATEVMWRYPSSTIIRSSVDVWVLLALLLHLRTARGAWAIAAGALTGLALLLEMDTGVYVGAAFCGYWVWCFGAKDPAHRPHLRVLGASAAAAATVLFGGLWIASRGSFFSAAFWKGLAEPLILLPGGVTMLPIAAIPDWSLLLFAAVLAVYFATFGLMVVKCVRREAELGDIFAGCVASYGMAALLLFIGRSHPHNLFHVSIPFSILVVAAAARGAKALALRAASLREKQAREFWRPFAGSLPWLALACALGWLWMNPAAQFYPGLLHGVMKQDSGNASPNEKAFAQIISDTAIPLLADTQDVLLPQQAANYANAFQTVTRKLHDLNAAGNSVAVLDNTDTIFYLASGVAPWGRYSPGLSAIGTKKMLAEFTANLAAQGPQYVMMRPDDSHSRQRGEQDVWQAVRASVERAYHLDASFGAFEIWRRD